MISPSDTGTPTGSPTHGLLTKYSLAAPRYTSYPPATLFHSEHTLLNLDEALAADNAPGAGPISLYFHLPFCETRCWYCGCNTVITRRRGAADEYLDLLEQEIAITCRTLDPRRPVTQLHLGGGTPTFLTPEQLRRLNRLVREHFHFADDAEISAELDPRRLTENHVAALREIGVWRASLGIQDTDRRVQLAINRFQPHELNHRAAEWLRRAGVRSINVDLIYGLPLQTPQTFARTIDDVLDLKPERLSVFSYAHVPWMKPAQLIFEDRGQLPATEEKLKMFLIAHEYLTNAGYIDIGLDHFARPDDELAVALSAGTLQRNFQGYSTRAGASLYAFGVSAISQTPDSYRQNFKDLPSYAAALGKGNLPTERGLRLTAEDQRRRTIIMRIMCDRGLDYARLSAEFGGDFERAYALEIESLHDLAADGVVEFSPHGLKVTALGVPLLRVVAMRFDNTLKAMAGKHSKTI